jgi:hypothetical protein
MKERQLLVNDIYIPFNYSTRKNVAVWEEEIHKKYDVKIKKIEKRVEESEALRLESLALNNNRNDTMAEDLNQHMVI